MEKFEGNKFRVRKSALWEIKREFKKLEKRAKKLDVPAPTFQVVEEYNIKLTEDPYTGAMLVTEIYVPMVVIEIKGSAPKFEGWTFLGTLEHTNSGNLLKSVPGKEIPENYRHVDRWCDHCQLNRVRKDTFVVQHKDGTTLQVGRQCIKDFLGHKSPENIVKWADYMIKLAETDWEDSYGFGGAYMNEDPAVTLKACLEMSAAVIREYGWVSASKAEEEWVTPTKEIVWENLFEADKLKKEERTEVIKDDIKLAERAREWARNVEPNGNSYLGNIQVIADNDYVQTRQIGIACSIIGTYMRKFEQKQREKVMFVNEWFGEPKQRLDLTIRVLGIYAHDGLYGTTWIHKMVTDTGHRVTWFCSSYNGVLEEGKSYKVKATVKKHTTWQEKKETQVNRVKVVEEVEDFQHEEEFITDDDIKLEKIIRVHCKKCDIWMDENKVTATNIEEDMYGRDKLWFTCPVCKTTQISLRVG